MVGKWLYKQRLPLSLTKTTLFENSRTLDKLEHEEYKLGKFKSVGRNSRLYCAACQTMDIAELRIIAFFFARPIAWIL